MADYYKLNDYLSEGEQSAERETFFGVGDADPRPRPTATLWVTRDGQWVRVRDMADSHLVNTIRLLRRRAEVKMMAAATSLDAYLASNPPDGAYDAATQAEGELLEMDADDYLEATCPTFPALLAEAEKRGLDV